MLLVTDCLIAAHSAALKSVQLDMTTAPRPVGGEREGNVTNLRAQYNVAKHKRMDRSYQSGC